MELNKREIQILRNGLEVLIDCDTSCIESIKKPCKKFRTIYPYWKKILEDEKINLKEAKNLDEKLWKELGLKQKKEAKKK